MKSGFLHIGLYFLKGRSQNTPDINNDLLAIVLPAVNEGTPGAVEVLEQRGVGPFGEFQFGQPGGIAVEKTRVRFEVFGAANDAAEIGRWRRGVAATVEGEESVGETAEVDAGALAEFHPVGIGEDFRRWRREEVAPVAFVSGRHDGAGMGVRAGSHDAK